MGINKTASIDHFYKIDRGFISQRLYSVAHTIILVKEKFKVTLYKLNSKNNTICKNFYIFVKYIFHFEKYIYTSFLLITYQ